MKAITMVDKLKLIMHYIVVITLTIILNINLIEATCNKRLKLLDVSNNRQQQQQEQQHDQLQSSKSSTILRQTQNHIMVERSIRNDDDYSSYNKDNIEDLQDQGVELDSERIKMRLEYNKYRILSELKMRAEPETLNPDLNLALRKELLSTVTKNISANNYFRQERRDSGVGNLRHKRSLACNQVKSNKDACCLETFYVNFTEIGWDKWIIYPPGYNANYCRGQCDLSHSRYYHSTLLSKFSNVIGLCCSPKQMASLRLLYIDENNKVHQKSMPDMIVESCDCA